MRPPLHLLIPFLFLALFSCGLAHKGEPVRYEINIESSAGNAEKTSQTWDILHHRLEYVANGRSLVVENTGGNTYEVKFYTDYPHSEIEKLLTTRGVLGFWETYSVNELESSILELFSLADNSAIHHLVARSIPLQTINSVLTFEYIPDNQFADAYALIKELIAGNVFPQDAIPMPGPSVVHEGNTYHTIYLLRYSNLANGPVLDYTHIKSANVSEHRKPHYSTDISLDDEGSLLWAAITEENIGRQLAFVFDNEVVFAPVVQSKIEGGKMSVSGNKSLEESMIESAIINTGPLKLPVQITQQESQDGL